MKHPQDNDRMTVREHLSELKKRILTSFIVFTAFLFVSLSGSERLLKQVMSDAADLGYAVMIGAVQDGFVWRLILSACISLFATLPLIIFNVICFAGADNSLKAVIINVLKAGAVSGLIGCGAYIGKRFLIPVCFLFLRTQAAGIEGLNVMVTLKDFMRLYLCGILISALTAAMPVLVYLLGTAGLITSTGMKEKRPYFTVIAFVLAAMITPPDVVSQIIVGTMLILFYESGILVLKCLERRNDKTCIYRSKKDA
ncbi:MAG: twin-arginine translocase subunit TatC [Lachnospiraceae bacterium]|nr:twin-arginine translocase subunit TatC [Lachnospiraceae bacterium]